MACGCSERNGSVVTKEFSDETTPTTQCIACAQKHCDQAYMAWHEWGYRKTNRRFIRGEMRALVLHCYKRWPSIADKARECSLMVQNGNDEEAEALLDNICSIIDSAFDEEYPDVAERIRKVAGE